MFYSRFPADLGSWIPRKVGRPSQPCSCGPTFVHGSFSASGSGVVTQNSPTCFGEQSRMRGHKGCRWSPSVFDGASLSEDVQAVAAELGVQLRVLGGAHSRGGE